MLLLALTVQAEMLMNSDRHRSRRYADVVGSRKSVGRAWPGWMRTMLRGHAGQNAPVDR